MTADAFACHVTPVTEGDWEGWSRWSVPIPFEQHTGPFYNRRHEDGDLQSGFIPRAHNCRHGGTVHGGALLTFADYSLFVISADAMGDNDGVTVSLNSEFLSPALPDQRLTARGKVTKAGKRMIFVQGQMEQEGRPVLAFSGIIAVMPVKG